MEPTYKFVNGEKIELTEQEVAELNNVDMTTIEAALALGKSNSIRIERDNLLKNVVDPIVCNPLRWAEFSTDTQQAYIDYRRLLLDIPQQADFPNNVIWPTPPQ